MALVTIALCALGAAAAVGGWLLARKLEKQRKGVIDEGVGGTLDALGGLAAYALMVGGVVLCLIGLFLPAILD